MKTHLTRFLFVFNLIQMPNCAEKNNMKPFVVGGDFADIANFPHSAFLDARCLKQTEHWICGSSILNQNILLTAAHCLQGCLMDGKSNDKLLTLVGHSNLNRVSLKREVTDVIIHKYYTEKSMNNDIGLAVVKEDFPLGRNVKRVIISRNFPDKSVAYEGFVAGWGLISDSKPISGVKLKYVYQKLRSMRTCSMIGHLHDGMFCAGSTENTASRPAQGDSGSALVTANGVHQIGLVSFCVKRFPALMVYTNVSYYYNWISTNAKKLYCDSKKRRK